MSAGWASVILLVLRVWHIQPAVAQGHSERVTVPSPLPAQIAVLSHPLPLEEVQSNIIRHVLIFR